MGSIFVREPREAGEAAGEASVVNLDRNLDGGEGRSFTAATDDRDYPLVLGRTGICLLERRDGQEEV